MNRILVLFITFCLSVLSYGQNAVTLRKARAGNANAQCSMAWTYKYGEYGAEKNDEKYVYWLKKAANGGLNYAQYELGKLYCYGDHGLPKDKEKYLNWCKKAAFNGYSPAFYSLGIHYKNTGDKEEAIYWLKKGMDLVWKEKREEHEFCAETLRELGVHYHPGDNNSYSTTSNTSSHSSSSSNSNNSVPIRQQQPVQEWNPCIGCGGTGLCTYCQGKGKRWYGNSYENCVTCHGSMYCQQCYGKKGYYTTVYR